MTNQTEDDYKTVLNKFNNFAIKNNINFESDMELEIITNFEKASINTINKVFLFVIFFTFVIISGAIFKKKGYLQSIWKIRNLI